MMPQYLESRFSTSVPLMAMKLVLALILELLHVVVQGVDEVVGDLPVALPGVAQQIQMSLLGPEAAQIVYRVEVRQTRVVVQVLLRDCELGKLRLGDPVQRLELDALLPLPAPSVANRNPSSARLWRCRLCRPSAEALGNQGSAHD